MSKEQKDLVEIVLIDGIPYHDTLSLDKYQITLTDKFIFITEKEGAGDWIIEINIKTNALSFTQEATDLLVKEEIQDSTELVDLTRILYRFRRKEDHPPYPPRDNFILVLRINV